MLALEVKDIESSCIGYCQAQLALLLAKSERHVFTRLPERASIRLATFPSLLARRGQVDVLPLEILVWLLQGEHTSSDEFDS